METRRTDLQENHCSGTSVQICYYFAGPLTFFVQNLLQYYGTFGTLPMVKSFCRLHKNGGTPYLRTPLKLGHLNTHLAVPNTLKSGCLSQVRTLSSVPRVSRLERFHCIHAKLWSSFIYLLTYRKVRRYQLVQETRTSCQSSPEGMCGWREITEDPRMTLETTEPFLSHWCMAECGTRLEFS